MSIDPTEIDLKADHPSRPRRRTIVKGAAWSIPVISFAVAAPLAAASEPQTCDPTKQPTVSPIGYVIAGPGILPEERDLTGWTNTPSAPGPAATQEFHSWGLAQPGFLSEGDTSTQNLSDPNTTVTVTYRFTAQKGGVYDLSATVKGAFGGSGDQSARQTLIITANGAGADLAHKYTVGGRAGSWWANGSDPNDLSSASDSTLKAAGYTLLGNEGSAEFSGGFTATSAGTVTVTYAFSLPPRMLQFNTPSNDNDDLWVSQPSALITGCAAA
ncbi:hypothetical protein SAMN05443377_13220 [Propionibacterium cyclohexanicum]|uniref:Uncharacterized protein n=1 Tax=Propionibacterium cyclohexanicum TaxID=64702 RepID=A0A1H9TZI9_9ACTN|nr:hypothetical protein [Propionibacterium cyclohexanicum]SES02472.1 hypothetical protein SAMN05443377_13220 [Propionibacterium cyclohexanicum]